MKIIIEIQGDEGKMLVTVDTEGMPTSHEQAFIANVMGEVTIRVATMCAALFGKAQVVEGKSPEAARRMAEMKKQHGF